MKNTKNRIFLPMVFYALLSSSIMGQSMDKIQKDRETLSQLNAQFIKNFILQDTIAHNQIIHKDFVCIQNSGEVVNRSEYMKGWALGYKQGGFTSFDYTDEDIRIFGNTALVRSRTLYIKTNNGQTMKGSSIYTDTYIKEKGRWWCVQAQITPLK